MSEDVLPFALPESLLNREGRERLMCFYVECLKKIASFEGEGDSDMIFASQYDPTREATSIQRYIMESNLGLRFPPKRFEAMIVGYQNKDLAQSVASHDKAFARSWADSARDLCSRTLVRMDRFRDSEFHYVELGMRVVDGKEIRRTIWRWFGQPRPNVSSSMQGIRAMDFQVPEDLIWAAEYHLGFRATEVRKVWQDYVSLMKDRLCSPEIHDWNIQQGLWSVAKKRAIKK